MNSRGSRSPRLPPSAAFTDRLVRAGEREYPFNMSACREPGEMATAVTQSGLSLSRRGFRIPDDCFGDEARPRGRYGASRRRVGTRSDAGGSPPHRFPRRGPLVSWEVIAGTRTTRTRRWAALLLAGEEEQRPLSEDGAAGLVRPVGRRRLPRCAGSIGTSNVACRGRTPDLTTAIQAVAKSGVGAGRTGPVTRITDHPFRGLPASMWTR